MQTDARKVAQGFSSVLKNTIAQRLKEQRVITRQHTKEVAKKAIQKRIINNEARHIRHRAVIGAKKLVQLWEIKEIQEVHKLVNIAGSSRIILFENEFHYDIRFLNWKWVHSRISISSGKGLEIYVLQFTEINSEGEFNGQVFYLNDPYVTDRQGNTRSIPLSRLIDELHNMSIVDPEWIVDASKMVESSTPLTGLPARAGWLAFLAACDNDHYIAQVLETALQVNNTTISEPI